MFVTALPTIAQMVGANRILRGVVDHPSDGRSVARGRGGTSCASPHRAPGARDARDRGRARHDLGAARRDAGAPAAVTAASFVLEHVPDLVRYGSKPSREPEQLDAAERRRSARSTRPSPTRRTRSSSATSRRADLWDVPRDWWRHPVEAATAGGARGDVMDQARFYDLLAEVDQFDLVRMGAEPEPGQLALVPGDEVVGAFAGDHERRRVAHRRRCCSRTCRSRPAACTRCATCSRRTGRRSRLDHARDRLRRGGRRRSLPARRRQRREGDRRAVRARERERHRREVVLRRAGARDRGRRRADRGRHRGAGRRRGRRIDGQARHEVRGRAREGVPDASRTCSPAWRCCSSRPTGRTDRSCAPTRSDACRSRPASAPQAQLEALVGAPLDAMGIAHRRRRHVRDRDPQPGDHRAAGRRRRRRPQLQDARRASASCAASSSGPTSPAFARAHGMPGFSPTQGHIASAVPWIPHALARDARRRPAPDDVDREGVAVPRPADAAVGRRRP